MHVKSSPSTSHIALAGADVGTGTTPTETGDAPSTRKLDDRFAAISGSRLLRNNSSSSSSVTSERRVPLPHTSEGQAHSDQAARSCSGPTLRKCDHYCALSDASDKRWAHATELRPAVEDTMVATGTRCTIRSAPQPFVKLMDKISNPGLSVPTIQLEPPSETKGGAPGAFARSQDQHALLGGLPSRTKKALPADPDSVISSSRIPQITIVDTASVGSNTRGLHTPAVGLNHQFLSAFGPAKVTAEPSDGPGIYHDLQPVDGRHFGEESGIVFETKVTYLNGEERNQCKIAVKNGLIYGADGQPIDTRDASVRPGKTPERAIFVMDKHGNIYLSKFSKKGVFHHSSFLSGQPVAAAGDIRIENGRVTDVSRTSGHYQPTSNQLRQFMQQLSKLGVPTTYQVHDEATTHGSI